MAALLSAPDMLAALVIVAIYDSLVSPADRNSCVVLRSLVFRRGFLRGWASSEVGFLGSLSEIWELPFSDLVLRQKVVARGGPSSIILSTSSVIVLVSVVILRIWSSIGVWSALVRFLSGCPEGCPVVCYRLKVDVLLLWLHLGVLGGLGLSCVSLELSGQVRACKRSSGFAYVYVWEIWGFESAPPFCCSSPVHTVPPGYVRLPCLCLGLVPAIMCCEFWCHRNFKALVKGVIVSGSQMRTGFGLDAPSQCRSVFVWTPATGASLVSAAGNEDRSFYNAGGVEPSRNWTSAPYLGSAYCGVLSNMSLAFDKGDRHSNCWTGFGFWSVLFSRRQFSICSPQLLWQPTSGKHDL